MASHNPIVTLIQALIGYLRTPCPTFSRIIIIKSPGVQIAQEITLTFYPALGTLFRHQEAQIRAIPD